jgi:hypothetical protein
MLLFAKRTPRYQFFIGSSRKVFTIGELINEIGPAHTFKRRSTLRASSAPG